MQNTHYDKIKASLEASPRHWLVTGAAGFIGSQIVETLLKLSQQVTGLDNFMTGTPKNIEAAKKLSPKNFRFIEGDIRDAALCAEAVRGVDIVLHHAALGSVPHSISDPQLAHAINVDGFMNMLLASKEAKVKRFVYASSSACYGDSTAIPAREGEEGNLLSPYAATKAINDLYAQVFSKAYSLPTIGLRYFNIFGPRQDPNGPYAAVIPLWMNNLMQGAPCFINGDGETTRDFCYVDNAVQANILAGVAPQEVTGEVLNIAVGTSSTLNELYAAIRNEIGSPKPASFREFREGDVRHSLADISKAKKQLGYAPTHQLNDGIRETVKWFTSL
jgi:UDP-N-acetylglucosamine 4-epimerase